MTHSEVVMAAYKWLLRDTKCGVALREYKSARFSTELPDVIGFDSSGVSYVIECKVSRADFLADAKKPFRISPETGMGAQRYYCCPGKMINAEELPRNWGLIRVEEDGVAWLAHDPYSRPADGVTRHFERNRAAEYLVMYSALKRMNLRGALEQIYEKLSVTPSTMRSVRARAEVGAVWQKKSNPHQRFIVGFVNDHLVEIKSMKSGQMDRMKPDKFYREYERED